MPIDQYRRTPKAQANDENPLPPDPIAVIISTTHLRGDIRMDARKPERIARGSPPGFHLDAGVVDFEVEAGM